MIIKCTGMNLRNMLSLCHVRVGDLGGTWGHDAGPHLLLIWCLHLPTIR